MQVKWVEKQRLYHKNNDEDEADPHYDEEGDQVVLQRQAEVWDQDQVSSGQTGTKHIRKIINL